MVELHDRVVALNIGNAKITLVCCVPHSLLWNLALYPRTVYTWRADNGTSGGLVERPPNFEWNIGLNRNDLIRLTMGRIMLVYGAAQYGSAGGHFGHTSSPAGGDRPHVAANSVTIGSSVELGRACEMFLLYLRQYCGPVL